VDLVDGKRALQNFNAIKSYASTKAKSLLNSPIIPVSAQHKLNIDYVCQYLAELPVPKRDLGQDKTQMIVVRSFDINKPNTELPTLKGGVAGGSVLRGTLRVGMRLEVRPGLVFSKPDGSTSCKPLFTKVVSLSSEQTKLDVAYPGGLIGVETTLDPSLTKSDALVGQVLGIPGKMPPVFQTIVVKYEQVKREALESEDENAIPISATTSTSTTASTATSSSIKASSQSNLKGGKTVGHKVAVITEIPPLKKGVKVTVNVNSLTTEATVIAVKEIKNQQQKQIQKNHRHTN